MGVAMIDEVLQFLYGGLTTLCVLVGVFFLRYWKTQNERLFLWFTFAFWAFAASWGVHLVFATSEETGPNVYLFRLGGFLMIGIGIVDKNRRARRESEPR